MSGDDARLWTDQSWLRDVQYRTDANLAARQSIYACQQPRLNLPALVFELAGARTFGDRLRLDDGAHLLASEFSTVTRHDFTSELLIPGTRFAEVYIRSMITTQALPEPGNFVQAVVRQIPLDQDGIFRVQTHSGCLICS